ncbi:MAG: nucleotide exchange factor GrpE [Porticoccaceae bacterium]
MSTKDQHNDTTTEEQQLRDVGENDGQQTETEAGDEVGAAAQPSVEELQAEVASLKEQLLLVHADMQNLRRRAERDVENAHKYALDKFVGDLVAVVDNLERATAAIDPDIQEMTALGEGVQLTLKNFLDVLRRFNVEQVDPKGEPFDPDKHQAMTMVPNPELAPNTVMDVFQKGYLLNGRLVRPAMVVVSKPE